MKRKKLERLIVEIIEDREALIRAMERTQGVPAGAAFTPLTGYVPSNTTLAPWCALCQGFHMPGAGPCTGTYTWTSRSTGGVQ